VLRDTAPWDSNDYFSHESQYVGQGDARALVGAILRALRGIPSELRGEIRWGAAEENAPRSPVPSQESAIAGGLSLARKNALRRLAAFADSGGFTIGSSPQ
jgi:hypothetical protein